MTFLLLHDLNTLTTTAQFFVSSNTQSDIGVFDIMDDNSVTMSVIDGIADDADGIYYDESADVLYQLNRSFNKINAYSNVSTNPTLICYFKCQLCQRP